MDKSQTKRAQKRVVLASVLKPVDDTRMFEKMAMTLAATGGYELYVIGYASKGLSGSVGPITLLPLPRFGRLSFQRLIAPWRVLKKALKVKPEVLIVNSHELLLVGIINRILFGTVIIYDIQENYYRNLLHTKAFPVVLRGVLAVWVRLKEKLSAGWFNWFFLAEKGYAGEMDFFGERYTVLQNKAVIPAGFEKQGREAGKLRLLFSGTLAETTGVFEAIRLAQGLRKVSPGIRLKVIGYCAQPAVLARLRSAIADLPFIQLVGGGELVPHGQIMEAICEADFGIIYYPPSPHTQNSIPTKLYEYLAAGLPVLLQGHEPWVAVAAPFGAAIVVDFERPDLQAIIEQMEQGRFYPAAATGVTWQEEGADMVCVLESLCSR